MRLQQYLNEDTWTYEDMVSLIKSNCKPFLKDWQTKYRYNFLYSGREYKTDFDMRSVRKNRRPMTTPLEWHNIMDGWFNKKFGVRARSNSIFGNFNKYHAMEYGDVFIIFPIGKYVMISSDKVKDLFIEISREFNREVSGDEINKGFSSLTYKDKERIVANFLEKSNYKKNQFNHKEQMLVCKKYYMIDNGHEDRLLEDLK